MKKKLLSLLAVILLAVIFSAAARHFYDSYRLDRELESLAEKEADGKTALPAASAPEKEDSPRIAEEALEEGPDFVELYAGRENVVITADAAFELFRRFVERAYDGIYGTFLYDQYASLFVDLTDNLEERYEAAEGEDRMTTRNALLFSSICVKLCLPDARIPISVGSDTEKEIKLIKEASFIGERNGRPCDYTVYASFAEKAETPWGGAALLRAFLERRFFSLEDKEDLKTLLVLAEALFNSGISSQNYGEAARFLKVFDGETRVMTIKEFWDLALASLPASYRAADLFSLADNEEFLNKALPLSKSAFDPPPWRDPSQILEPAPKVWFFQPALALAPRTFRELHRWVIRPKTEHLLYVLGVSDALPSSEEILLEALKKEVRGNLGIMDRAVECAALLKPQTKKHAPALLVRSMLYTAEKPDEQTREADWPKIKAVYVEEASDFFRALAELIKELNELYTELDLFRVMTSYKKNTLTPDRLLEAEQIFQELADMAREDALYLQSGEKEAVSGERALMNARRFLTLLSSQKTQDPPWEKETPLGLEYNFQKISLAGLRKPRLAKIAVPGKEGEENYLGVRYQFFEKENDLQETK